MKKEIDPRMHSAEHILNQTMVRMFDSDRCFSAHIERKKSKCDYHFDRPLTAAEVQEIERRVNKVIASDMAVNETFMERAEARNRFNLDRLPAGAGEEIRVVTVGDYDTCPCIGPHVASTGEIGSFRITSASFEAGVLRVRYKLGKAKA